MYKKIISIYLMLLSGLAIAETPLHDLTDTWNNAGTVFDGIKMDITNTASATGSSALWLGFSGTEVFRVDKDGTIYASAVAMPTISSIDTLTNKTITLGGNTLTGTIAQFDTALTNGNFTYSGGAFHDGFSDFVANEHIDHTAVTLTAGTGLDGGGDISVNRTFNIDATVATLTGTQILSNKTLTLPQINDTSSDHQYIFGVSELTTDRTVTLPLLGANDVFTFNSFVNLWGDGIKQTFNPSSTIAGFNPGSLAGQPSSPANGDIIYNSTANQMQGRVNGTWVDLGAGGSGETNTASNLGGGLANFDTKSSVDLRFNSFATADFDLGSNLLSVDRGLIATWTAVHSFADNNFQINNPANTFQYIFGTAALAADRIIELPLLTGNDTLVFNDFAATLTNKTIDAASNTLTLFTSSANNQLLTDDGSGGLVSESGLVFDGTSLGIGTGSPGGLLDLTKAGANAEFHLESTGGSGTKFLFRSINSNGRLTIGSTTLNHLVIDPVTDNLLLIETVGLVGVGKDDPSAKMDITAPASTVGFNIDLNATPGDAFTVTDSGSNVLFVIDGTGQVGTGTSVPASLFDIDGAIGTAIVTVTGNTTLDATYSTVLVNASGAMTITLPTVSSSYNSTDGIGRIYIIKKIDGTGALVTVDGNSAEEIDGATTAVLTTQFESITIQSNGTFWSIL